MFTALTDSNRPLDNEQCEWLLRLSAEAQDIPPTDPISNLKTTVKRQLQAQLSQLLNKNREYFQRGREKLENWAEDQLQTAERQLRDTRLQLKEAKRLANTVEEQKAAQQSIKQLERQQRRQRQEIFDEEDAIEACRDQLIDVLEQQMHRQSSTHHLFRIR
ncbi:hypothetical protein [Microbulbifer halophilus]|uniref:Uncharacterized protein n=1 Tax=Microbulbifer halophilus TaxID=453963 RepID=A0ABW5EJR8_9GAMM|nr:hypothetical protein [Microbulbifer halophilus]MCW8126394.1 hypothetical protein [Microbulbifer halophilus]